MISNWTPSATALLSIAISVLVITVGCGDSDNQNERASSELQGLKVLDSDLSTREMARAGQTQTAFLEYCSDLEASSTSSADSPTEAEKREADEAADYLIEAYAETGEDPVIRNIMHTLVVSWAPECPPAQRLQDALDASEPAE